MHIKILNFGETFDIVKALYTFWSKPLRENLARCHSEKNFIMMFIYSMLWSAKWFDKVELNTDNYGYNIFRSFETEKIKIKNTLNNFEDLDSYLFWAYPKIFSLTLQDEPFIHIDGDIFIFRKLKDTLFSGDFGFQNLEETYFKRTYEKIVKFCDSVLKTKPIEWNPNLNSSINCGLMYFKNPEDAKYFHDQIKKYFIDLDQEIADKIKKELKEIIKTTYVTYPLVFEQYYLNCLLREKEVNYLLDLEQVKKEEQGELTIQGYVHLIEDKNNPIYLNNIELRFQLEFPDEYKLFKNLNLK